MKIIRDVAWHPFKMEIYSSNLNGDIYRWFNSQLGGLNTDEDEVDE